MKGKEDLWRRLGPALLLPFLTLAPAAVATAQGPNKLGIFMIGNVTSGGQEILSANPPLVVALDPFLHQSLAQAVENYKKNNPNGEVLLRLTTPGFTYEATDNPEKSAQDFFQRGISPRLNRLGPKLSLYNFVESPLNESTPDWSTDENVDWLGKFHVALARKLATRNLKTCVSIGVGDVGGQNEEEIANRFGHFLPALEEIIKLGGKICYHGYTLSGSQSEITEKFEALRYRIFMVPVRKAGLSTERLVILSEVNWDKDGSPNSSWGARTTPRVIIDWFGWFQDVINRDPAVNSAAGFQIGDNGQWWSFNLEQVAPDYAKLIRSR